jgi:hypothetical protein
MQSRMGRRRRKDFHQGQIKCLVYDPTVSPHYEVFSIHPLSDQHQLKSALSSSYPLEMLPFVHSPVTGCWEERLFVPEGEGGRVVEAIADTRLFVPDEDRVAETIADNKVYWREALYLPYQNGFLLRYV